MDPPNSVVLCVIAGAVVGVFLFVSFFDEIVNRYGIAGVLVCIIGGVVGGGLVGSIAPSIFKPIKEWLWNMSDKSIMRALWFTGLSFLVVGSLVVILHVTGPEARQGRPAYLVPAPGFLGVKWAAKDWLAIGLVTIVAGGACIAHMLMRKRLER